MSYKLLKDILLFKAGTVIEVEHGYGHLGNIEWDGWDIPEEIILKYPDWFMPILGY